MDPLLLSARDLSILCPPECKLDCPAAPWREVVFGSKTSAKECIHNAFLKDFSAHTFAYRVRGVGPAVKAGGRFEFMRFAQVRPGFR